MKFNKTLKEYHKNQWKYFKWYISGKLPDDVEKKNEIEALHNITHMPSR